MVRAWLKDDVDLSGDLTSRVYQHTGVVQAVEGDCDYGTESPPWVYGDNDPDEPTNLPMLSLFHRTRAGYTEDGTPQFTWEQIGSGRAMKHETREEIDPIAGVTFVVAETQMMYQGTVEPHETLMVVDLSTNDRWRVVKVAQVGDRLDMTMQRVDAEPSGA